MQSFFEKQFLDGTNVRQAVNIIVEKFSDFSINLLYDRRNFQRALDFRRLPATWSALTQLLYTFLHTNPLNDDEILYIESVISVVSGKNGEKKFNFGKSEDSIRFGPCAYCWRHVEEYSTRAQHFVCESCKSVGTEEKRRIRRLRKRICRERVVQLAEIMSWDRTWTSEKVARCPHLARLLDGDYDLHKVWDKLEGKGEVDWSALKAQGRGESQNGEDWLSFVWSSLIWSAATYEAWQKVNASCTHGGARRGQRQESAAPSCNEQETVITDAQWVSFNRVDGERLFG